MINFAMIASLVEKEAPLLASVIGTANPMAAILVNLLLKAFGILSPMQLPAAIDADPDAAIKLKQIEADHNDVLIQSNMNDTASAREREEDIVAKTGKRDWVLDLIAILFITFFFVICTLNYFFSIKDDHILIMLLGQITAGVGYILSYYFGSSNK